MQIFLRVIVAKLAMFLLQIIRLCYNQKVSEETNLQIEISEDNPVVFVPGFMASRLWRNRKGLFSPAVLVWPLSTYLPLTGLTLLQDEALLTPDGLVGNYYDNLIEFISRPKEQDGLGKTKDRDFWVFTYDWRQSCHNSGLQLKQFIAEKLAKANQLRQAQNLPLWQKADIINHSLGGLVTRSAIIEHAATVERVVYIATPHYGTAKAYFALHPDTNSRLVDDFVKGLIPGWYWDILRALPNVWFVENWLSQIVTSFQSVYELLPDQFFLEAHDLLTDATKTPPHPVSGLEQTYFRHPWQFPPEMQSRIKQAMQFKEILGRELPGEHNLVIYNNSLPTYAQGHYNGQIIVPELLPTGDSTVSEFSANPDSQADHFVINASHTELPALAATHKAIFEWMTRK